MSVAAVFSVFRYPSFPDSHLFVLPPSQYKTLGLLLGQLLPKFPIPAIRARVCSQQKKPPLHFFLLIACFPPSNMSRSIIWTIPQCYCPSHFCQRMPFWREAGGFVPCLVSLSVVPQRGGHFSTCSLGSGRYVIWRGFTCNGSPPLGAAGGGECRRGIIWPVLVASHPRGLVGVEGHGCARLPAAPPLRVRGPWEAPSPPAPGQSRPPFSPTAARLPPPSPALPGRPAPMPPPRPARRLALAGVGLALAAACV